MKLDFPYTPVPNWYWDIAPDLSPSARDLLLYLFRQTLGWKNGKRGERRDQIDLGYEAIMQGSCVKSTASVAKALKELKELGLIEHTSTRFETQQIRLIMPTIPPQDSESRLQDLKSTRFRNIENVNSVIPTEAEYTAAPASTDSTRIQNVDNFRRLQDLKSDKPAKTDHIAAPASTDSTRIQNVDNSRLQDLKSTRLQDLKSTRLQKKRAERSVQAGYTATPASTNATKTRLQDLKSTRLQDLKSERPVPAECVAVPGAPKEKISINKEKEKNKQTNMFVVSANTFKNQPEEVPIKLNGSTLDIPRLIAYIQEQQNVTNPIGLLVTLVRGGKQYYPAREQRLRDEAAEMERRLAGWKKMASRH